MLDIILMICVAVLSIIPKLQEHKQERSPTNGIQLVVTESGRSGWSPVQIKIPP